MAASKKTKFMKKEISKLVDKGPSKGPLKGQKFTQKRAVAAAINVGKKKGFKFGKKANDESTGSMFDSVVSETELTTTAREHIAPRNFAIPEKAPDSGSYPIEDLPHAKNALARVSQFGTPEEQARVRKSVYDKYPELKDRHDERAESASVFDGLLTEKKLEFKNRKRIAKKNFVFKKKAPAHGSFPIENLVHARDALSRAAAKGGSVEADVKAKVYKKYPGLKARHKEREESTSVFDTGISEGTTKSGLFDEIISKDVDEADDIKIEKLARTLTLTEDLVEIRNTVLSK
jgi:hypothetical protein